MIRLIRHHSVCDLNWTFYQTQQPCPTRPHQALYAVETVFHYDVFRFLYISDMSFLVISLTDINISQEFYCIRYHLLLRTQDQLILLSCPIPVLNDRLLRIY